MLRILKNTYLLCFVVILYFPITVLILNSFNHSKLSIGWEGFTLGWYLKLFESPIIIKSMKNSIIIGFLSAFFSSFIGTIASFGFYRYRYKGRKIIFFFIQTMITFPDIVLGISLALLFTIFKLGFGFFSLLISHIILTLPFAIMLLITGFKDLDKNILEAGKDLGANDFNILIKIILPLIYPNILAAFLICFTLSLDDVLVSFFVSGPHFEVLPITIFSLARMGVKPEVNAICTLMLIISVILIVFSQLLLKKQTND